MTRGDGSARSFEAVPRCPSCGYELTGLPHARCPECGEFFSWEQVLAQTVNPPRIAFERAGNARRGVFGLLVTWLTVLFLPWKFAAQALQRISLKHGLAFGGVCFASTFVSIAFGADAAVMATWLSTALVYLVLQTLWLTIVDWSGWNARVASARFWAAIGGYTSAVMATEFFHGPPLVEVAGLLEFALAPLQRTGISLGMGIAPLRLGSPPLLSWFHMAFWLTALGCCFFARARTRNTPPLAAVLSSLLVVASLYALYAAVIEYIGAGLLYQFFGGV